MSNELNNSTVLIELDALLDTRLATVASFGDSALDALFQSDYHNRLMDSFPGVDKAAYDLAYSKRDKTILKNAIITPIAEMIKEFTFNTLKQLLNSPFHYQPKILVNIHPYKLTDSEISILMSSLIAITNKKADIQVIDVAYKDITPSYVKNHISIMVLYEYYKWLEIHSLNEKFKKVTCPEVTLIGPALIFTDQASQITDIKESFEAVQTLAAPLIGLRLVPVENFSMVFKRPEKPT